MGSVAGNVHAVAHTAVAAGTTLGTVLTLILRGDGTEAALAMDLIGMQRAMPRAGRVG